jgi:flagellar hook-basal body complex protein FliE
MIDAINNMREIEELSLQKTELTKTQSEKAGSTRSFSSMLEDAISGARNDEESAAQIAEGFAKGDPGIGLQETIIAAEKASISLRYAVSLKNKLLESYRELMNTPL